MGDCWEEMKLFVITSDIPDRRHGIPGITAVNIVVYELLNSLQNLGYDIVHQIIFNSYRNDPELTSEEQERIKEVSDSLDIKILPPIFFDQYSRNAQASNQKSRLMRIINIFLGIFFPERMFSWLYPAVSAKKIVENRVSLENVDAVLTIWSPEGVAATYGLSDVPRIVYHGDIDFAPFEARVKDHQIIFEGTNAQGINKFRSAVELQKLKIVLAQQKRVHLKLMQDVSVIANVTASNADFYTHFGHPRSVYVRNTWSDSSSYDNKNNFSPQQEIGLPRSPIKVIGHVGYLNQTGSTYGLSFLLKEVMPHVKDLMGGLDFEVHIIGGGEIIPLLKPFAQQNNVIMRGFIEDLDQELLSSDVFLMLNNVGSYWAAYTRHMVAWSMGLCMIVHRNSQNAIPEIDHLVNSLVGTTPEEIAHLIYQAVTDEDLNVKIRKGGRAAYEKLFTPQTVAGLLSEEIKRIRLDKS